MMTKSKDLFDDSTMSFGEHLEVLRIHLWRALIGLMVGVIVALLFGQQIVAVVRGPIDRALATHGVPDHKLTDNVSGFDFWRYLRGSVGAETNAEEEASPEEEKRPDSGATSREDARNGTIQVLVQPSALAAVLHKHDPETYPAPARPNGDAEAADEPVAMLLSSPAFARLTAAAEKIEKPITLNVQEAFFTYLKVAFVAGLVLASPWVFYQLWLFVAAGLYPHERRYVYVYLPMSVVLFVGGTLFCFFLVFPFVLDFLLGFNLWLEVTPQIRLSEWITFAITLPLMFGISFQLPMVMLFLERISIFEAQDYREKRRLAVLVIAVLSMLLTPADPMSMMLMMLPLLALYELGIVLCGFSPAKSPFEAEAA